MKLKNTIALNALIICNIVFANVLANNLANNLENQTAKQITAVESGLRGSVQFANDPTWKIDERMKHHGVPGVSIAVIKDYKILWVKHYGVTDKETNKAIDGNTLFQAASISKPVAAYAALKLVEQKNFHLMNLLIIN